MNLMITPHQFKEYCDRRRLKLISCKSTCIWDVVDVDILPVSHIACVANMW